MRLFLDTSVLLAACGSAKGASREIFRLAPRQNWTLVTIPYVLDEVGRNLAALPYRASADWVRLRANLVVEDNILSVDRPAIFSAGKDRPILFSALAWADVLSVRLGSVALRPRAFNLLHDGSECMPSSGAFRRHAERRLAIQKYAGTGKSSF